MAAKLSNLKRQCQALAVILEANPNEVLRAVLPLIRDRELSEQAKEQLPPEGTCPEPRHGR